MISGVFLIHNGTRQGGVLSPYLFVRNICDLIDIKSASGCNIGGVFYNILAYADDLVLLAPIWSAYLSSYQSIFCISMMWP